MLKFKSLTAKFIFISLIMIAVLAVYFYADFRFTHHMKGEATRINIAGRQRMLTVKMMSSVKGMLDPLLPSEEKEKFRNVLNSTIAEYEDVLYSLRGGSEKLGLKPLDEHYKDSISQLNALVNLWQKTQKPVLLSIKEFPPERRNEACVKCHAVMRDKIKDVDAFVKSLEKAHEKGINNFDTLRLYVLGFLFIGAVFVVFYIRRSIVKPVGMLKDAAQEIEKGDFDVRVDVKTSDDIGALSSAFNSMAQMLKQLFTEQKLLEDDLIRHNKELLSLTDTSNVILTATTTENLYETICDIAVRNFGLKMAWLGLIDEGSYDIKPVAQAGFEDGYLTSIKVTYDDSPTGMAIKTKTSRVIQDYESDHCVTPWREEALKRDYRSSMAVPLIFSEGKVIGAINLYSSKPQFFTKERIKLFQVFANQAATAIENKWLVEGLEGKVRERTAELERFGFKLHKLYELSFTTKANAKEFANAILKEIAEMLDVDVAAVGSVSKGEWVAYAVADRKDFGIKEGVHFPLAETYCETICETKRPLVINDAIQSEEFKKHPDLIKHGVVSYLGVPVFIGEELFGVLCTFNKSPHDYTEYDLILHQLLSKRLEFEFVKEKYENELKDAMMQAETANRVKSDFITNLSHELRTPLNVIIGFSEMMKEGMAGHITDTQKEYLTDIYDSGNHLLSLINDLLDLSKIEAGRMELELREFNLKKLIEMSLLMFKERAMRHNIKGEALVEEGVENIIADERKIKQVLFNLLSNAFKFTPDGGAVTVRARGMMDEFVRHPSEAVVHRPSVIEITVEDTGPGISEEDQKKLFQPFQQLESPLTKRYKGTGLGLAISKNIVEHHAGKIWVESEVGKGSKFIFTIPVVSSKEVKG